MDSQNSQQQDPALRRDRLSVSAPAPKKPTGDRDPRDNFDYRDYGPSTTPSKKREAKSKSGATSPGSHVSADHPDDVLEPEQLVKRLESNIYEKETKGRLARYPDEDYQTNGVHAVSGSISSSTLDAKRTHRRRRNDKLMPVVPYRAAECTKLRRVMLNWSKPRFDETQRLVINTSVIPPNTKIESQNSVIWQHSNFENISLDELETLAAQLKPSGLQESEIGLTRRLLNRVKLVTERAFVGGSFLAPTAIRYDMFDASSYGRDKRCMFLSFPYFAVTKAQSRVTFRKGDSRHSTRTLLQSRYRLNETVERDNAQCIRMLDADSLNSCIKAPWAETSHLTQKVTDELIYVPQLWGLILGLDHMVTAGPISDQALQGSAFVLRDSAEPSVAHKCAFVRISFMNCGMPEDVTFPIDQCASWFGLLNKHQQIRNALRQGKDKALAKDYPLRIGGTELQSTIWASVQRSVDGEILRLWMESPKRPKVTVKDTDGDESSEERQVSGADDESFIEARPTSSPSRDFRLLDPVPVVRALLAWPVVDDFGAVDDCPADIQTKRFLNAIYGSLAAVCTEAYVAPGKSGGRGLKSDHSARPTISVAGKTARAVDGLGYERSYGESEASIEQQVWWETLRVFNYFIPREHDADSAPIRLFWGVVYELMVTLDAATR